MARTMKDSCVEWIGNIPEEWGIRKGKTLYSIQTGKLDANAEDIDGEYPFFTCSMYPKKINVYAFDCEALLVAGNGLVGFTQYYKGKFNAYQRTYVLSEFVDVYPQYLKYYMTNLLSVAVAPDSVGSVITFIKLGDLQNFYVTMPTIDEQKKIAEFLEIKVEEIDAIIRQTKETIEEYKKYKRAIITENVTRGLDNMALMKKTEFEHIGIIPKHWEVKKIKYVLRESGERTKTGKEEPLSMSQKWGLIPTKEMDVIPNMASSFNNCKIVHVNDLVFNKLKAHLGVFAKSGYEGLVSPDYAVYQPRNNDNMLFLEYVFKTPQYISQFIKYSRGVAQGLTRLYTEELFNIYIAMPPKEEQDRITDVVKERCAEIDALIAKKEAFIEEMEAYKKSFIYEYVTGKKEVL